jgi:SAM-dependent methyltransferase
MHFMLAPFCQLVRKGVGVTATRINLFRNKRKEGRCLEIGPGPQRISGFETLDIAYHRHIDYVVDAGRPLPFSDATFNIVYASHVLEHIPWYLTENVLYEWTRILKRGGVLEVWVPDGLKIAKAFVDAELHGSRDYQLDGWWKFNDGRDPCVWMSGRFFTYGDGSGSRCDPNWHFACFSARHLRGLLGKAGLQDIRDLKSDQVRGHNHGWINLGVAGTKP